MVGRTVGGVTDSEIAGADSEIEKCLCPASENLMSDNLAQECRKEEIIQWTLQILFTGE